MEEDGEKSVGSVMVIAVDDNIHSYHALQWTLKHLLSTPAAASAFKVIIVHARPTATSVVNIAGAGAGDILPYVESDLRKTASNVLLKAKEMCIAQSVHNVQLETMEGDARNVLCEAVDKFHADMLVVGSHGYGAIKRAVLGSVSDHCAHRARCSVMIVKKPKTKK